MKHNYFNRFINYCTCAITQCLIVMCWLAVSPYILTAQCLTDKTAGSNPADILALDDEYNKPSPYVYGDMLSVNDAGQFQGIGTELNPISFLTTKMRAFHAMDYDFNDNIDYNNTLYTDLIKPKDVNGTPQFMDLGSYGNFIGPQGITNISAATEILIRRRDPPLQELTWKEKIWQEEDWWPASAGLSYPDGIRESYKNYTERFIEVLAPDNGPRYIEVYQVGNELWDYPFVEDYHAMLEGAYNAFVNKYGPNTANWKMKLMPGSLQAAILDNTCDVGLRNNSNCDSSPVEMFNQMGDYLDVSNCAILSSLDAINTHAYSFDEGTLNYVHPEKPGQEFQRFKAAVAFRDANPILAGKGVWLTEVGYDSQDTGFDSNGNPAVGVGQYSQAAMNLRIFMITSRYHLERVDFYMGFDQNRTSNMYHGNTYNSSGFWRLGTANPGPNNYPSAKPSDGATPKPVFFTFRDFLDKFETKVFHEAVAEETDVHAYILANPDGSDPYLVFWSPTATDDTNVFADVAINHTINLPTGYKVSTTAATPFSHQGNMTTAPYQPSAAQQYANAVSGTNAGSTTLLKIRRMPSYIKLDNEANVAFTSCPTEIIIQAAQGETSVSVNWASPMASSTCTGSPTIVQSSGGSNGSNFSVGSSTVISYTATDDCNTSAVCSFTVTVNPYINNNPLTLSCSDDIIVTVAPGASGSIVNWNPPTAITDCPIDSCSGNTITGFNYLGELGGSEYYISEFNEKWTDAKVTCENKGGHLLTINSQAEQDFIYGAIDVAVLMGISDDDSNNTLEWVSGESISYTNWKVGQPDIVGMDRYGLLDYWSVSGLWELTNFWTSKPFVLEVPCSGGSGQPIITQTQGAVSGSFFGLGSTVIAFAASDDCENNDNCSFSILVQEDSDACPPTLEITTVDAVDADYQAAVSITSSMNGGVLAGAVVSYRAGDYVLLESGFSVGYGAVFLAEILGCQ